MGVFADAAEAKRVFDPLFERILGLEESNKQFAQTGAVLAVVYSNPDYFVVIDGRENPAVLRHEPGTKADIEIIMSCDTAHTFWKGELNFPVAMMKGKAKITGPSDTAMALLPAVTPGHAIYPEVLKEAGREDLI